MSNILWRIFKDSFLSGLLIPVKNEFVLPIYSIFHENGSFLPFLASGFAGGSIALMINFYFGRILFSTIAKYDSKFLKENLFLKVSWHFNTYFFLILIFSASNTAGCFLPFIAGLIRYNALYCFLLVIFSKVLAYISAYYFPLPVFS